MTKTLDFPLEKHWKVLSRVMTSPDLYFEILNLAVACLIDSRKTKVDARQAKGGNFNSPCGKPWTWRSNQQNLLRGWIWKERNESQMAPTI